ncbi:MAG: ribonuclease E/G [Devosia sp. 67-54]|uniref:Rne/Rng family ribonuclease n=1 Tax=unclassified Devosia TaxID=196773 RepID=UPI00095D8EAB|nr:MULTISPECIES: ribonuclease E/G [unclassified Devosia]MBN9304424.1 ribonuclease E/G [Devosia sp.]OJX18223.1 MAG: ribonuclease E/G [Devosia sp. 67-54]
MAIKRMLVDGIHPEETRIVVTNGNRLEEFDFESQSRRQLRGNIYLAKVTRVEPSLQAAFVEYGGNRHGFLAFSEIHPDYYQIPVADREALMRAEEEAEREEHAAEIADEPEPVRSAAAEAPAVEAVSAPVDSAEDDPAEQTENAPTEADAEADPQSTVPGPVEAAEDEAGEDDDPGHIEQAPANNEPVESLGGSGDLLEETRERRQRQPRRHAYKIQEVIKRRQVMLVQVVKEERGNKGAALTTYLSLAGRYSVLMPNTARGGGISRKITNAADRKRLKDIVGDLEVPQGQGIILRTAGASRTKAEVKRDFEYLQRLWESVRTLTLQSTAPCLVYEEGSLIKRTIRDLYSKDIDELWVAGDDAYREAKDFMRMIMPSHAKNVQLYKDDQPLFSKYNVEGQLDQMFSPQVTLPSGGYLVINPTEALVSIDVNSGRSTKEHNIEDTALQTNLEAAEEVARQLRLRDLAGLIVIDFIDMIENRSNRAVERKLKDALKNDRARIQVGRISHFGLMEMSRQRIRFGVVESSTHKCPTCNGTGLVRSVESVALMVMRNVEDHVLKKPGQSINVRVPVDVALYILNSKRTTLNNLEAKYGLSITIVADDHVGPQHYAIERGEARAIPGEQPQAQHVRVDSAIVEEIDDEAVEDEDDEEADGEAREARSDDNGERNGRRRRRRRGGRDRERGDRNDRPQPAQLAEADASDEAEGDGEDDEAAPQQANGNGAHDENGDSRRRRRRGRRGGRRNRREGGDVVNGDAGNGAEAPAEGVAGISEEGAERIVAAVLAQDAIAAEAGVEPAITVIAAEEDAGEDKPRRARRSRKSPDADAAVQDAVTDGAENTARPRSRSRRAKAAPPSEAEALEAAEAIAVISPEPAPAPAADAAAAPEPDLLEERPSRPKKELPPDQIVVSSSAPAATDEKPKKAGWWQRGFFGG